MNDIRQALGQAAGQLRALPEPHTGWEQDFCLDAGSLVFAGHFPGHPVLPAVTQIVMAQMLLEQGLGQACPLAGVDQAKFSAPAGPGMPLRLRVEQGRGGWQCTLESGELTLSRFLLKV